MSPATMDLDDAGTGLTKLVCFYLHGQEYGADIGRVKETMAVRPITPVFLTPSWLSGIINLRGDVVAVLDLSELLIAKATHVTDASRIVIVRDDDSTAGIIVDEMAELRALDLSELQPPPPTLKGESSALLSGIATLEGGVALRVLDLANLFRSKPLQAYRRQT